MGHMYMTQPWSHRRSQGHKVTEKKNKEKTKKNRNKNTYKQCRKEHNGSK
jgi:hypothetical protein